MTHPSVETALSGAAADAVRALQAELSGYYTEMRSAEVQLTEAILSAHAVTESGRAALQDIQRQLIEAITNPVAALDTPAGERQFLLFLRSKVAEIQDIVDTGALTDEDHAALTRALGSGYLLPASDREDVAPPAGAASTPEGGAGMLPALGSALGALPQATQGAATAPTQGAGGPAGAATPLAGLASGLLDRSGEPDIADEPAETPTSDESDDDRPGTVDDEETDADRETGTDRETGAGPGGLRPPGEKPQDGPAQTRPARLL